MVQGQQGVRNMLTGNVQRTGVMLTFHDGDTDRAVTQNIT